MAPPALVVGPSFPSRDASTSAAVSTSIAGSTSVATVPLKEGAFGPPALVVGPSPPSLRIVASPHPPVLPPPLVVGPSTPRLLTAAPSTNSLPGDNSPFRPRSETQLNSMRRFPTHLHLGSLTQLAPLEYGPLTSPVTSERRASVELSSLVPSVPSPRGTSSSPRYAPVSLYRRTPEASRRDLAAFAVSVSRENSFRGSDMGHHHTGIPKSLSSSSLTRSTSAGPNNLPKLGSRNDSKSSLSQLSPREMSGSRTGSPTQGGDKAEATAAAAPANEPPTDQLQCLMQ